MPSTPQFVEARHAPEIGVDFEIFFQAIPLPPSLRAE